MLLANVEWVGIAGPAALIDHTHGSAHALVVLDGEIVEDGRAYRAGDIRVSPARDRHFIRFGRTARCLVLEFGAPGRRIAARRIVYQPDLAQRLQRTTRIDAVADLVARPEWAWLGEDDPLPAWLAELEAHRENGRFLRVSRVGAVARDAGVSREHLARSYRRHFGTSISNALRARRLRAGFDLLTQSARPLAEVAAASGYADQSHMTRDFRIWIGQTPGALRQASRITSIQDPGPRIAVN